jgi:hypothetical protein
MPHFSFSRALVGNAARRLAGETDRLRRAAIRHQTHSDYRPSRELSEWLDEAHDASEHARADADPCAAPAYLTVLLATTVVAVCVYFVWIAPAFLADLTVEGAFVTWLYRPLLRRPREDCWPVAFELTGGPALVMALCILLTGLSFQLCAPQAKTIIEVWQHVARQNEQQGPPR